MVAAPPPAAAAVSAAPQATAAPPTAAPAPAVAAPPAVVATAPQATTAAPPAPAPQVAASPAVIGAVPQGTTAAVARPPLQISPRAGAGGEGGTPSGSTGSSAPGAAPAVPSSPAAEPAAAERDAAERALERALVQKGGLVVPPWGIEVVPELSFSHADGSAPAAASAGGSAFGARTEVATGTVTLRVGLPFDLQVEAEAPFVLSRLTPGGDEPEAPAEGAGLGDVRLGLTWHALRGRSGVPDVLVGGFWKSRSGKTAFDDPDVRVPLGTGVEQFGATLTLVKAVDPVVLLASAMYAVSAPRWVPAGWLEAGDTFGGSAGAVLAVSPETSLSFALEAQHARPLKLDEATLYRSDRTSAVFRVGVATAASRRGFFQVSLGMGLTSDVPQFEISVATPIQF